MQRTLMIIKPDAVSRGVIGDILSRVEHEGFEVLELQMVRLSVGKAEQFYSIHKTRSFFRELVEFMTSGPSVAMVLHREDAVAHLRAFIGPTNSSEAAAGTIRGDFGTDVQCNAVHASDSLENAAAEIAFFFGG